MHMLELYARNLALGGLTFRISDKLKILKRQDRIYEQKAVDEVGEYRKIRRMPHGGFDTTDYEVKKTQSNP